jgi:2-hydroxychromene-2-carboxylate isomerase
VPTFVFRGEPFFGQDRVDLLRWRLDHEGVARRPG